MASTPREPQRLKISTSGDPILKAVAKEVEDVDDESVQALIDDMFLTRASEENCVGLSAPQVGQSLRIIIVAPEEKEPRVMINPAVATHPMSKLKSGKEGCLSVPGVEIEVKRQSRIRVSFLDRYGKEQKEIFSGFDARIIQHEVDHLNGKLIA
jgi:peptide deformylase